MDSESVDVYGEDDLPESVVNGQRYSHDAMATTFEIIVPVGENEDLAVQAAHEAFERVDFLEGEFSRFVENSDISRINGLSCGEEVTLGLDAFDCLGIALEMSGRTGGAFDVTVGYLLDCWLDHDKSLRQPTEEELAFAREHTGFELIQLDREYITVRALKTPIRVDLGGVGKGYAVDDMGRILRDWGIGSALIHGGTSSMLALEAPAGSEGWPVTYCDPDDPERAFGRLNLVNRALAGSTLEQGLHIIDPRTARPIDSGVAAWVCGPDAARADALSTAFMIMESEEISRYCRENWDTMACVIRRDMRQTEEENLEHLTFGNWQECLR